MCRELFHDGPEKSVIERVIKQAIRRDARRSFAVLLAALVAFAVATPIWAQDSNGSAPAQKSGDAGAHGVYKVGGDVLAPVLIHSVEPEPADVKGTVQVTLWVDKNGNPSHVRVTHGLGMGLDEKAVEAVRQYKYKPGMKDGKPVLVELNIEVNFQAH